MCGSEFRVHRVYFDKIFRDVKGFNDAKVDVVQSGGDEFLYIDFQFQENLLLKEAIDTDFFELRYFRIKVLHDSTNPSCKR